MSFVKWGKVHASFFYVMYCILPSVLQNSDLLFPRHVLANLCHSWRPAVSIRQVWEQKVLGAT